MKLRLKCGYCGHGFVEYVYDQARALALRCPSCNSREVERVKEVDTDPFGYNEVSKGDAYIKKGQE